MIDHDIEPTLRAELPEVQALVSSVERPEQTEIDALRGRIADVLRQNPDAAVSEQDIGIGATAADLARVENRVRTEEADLQAREAQKIQEAGGGLALAMAGFGGLSEGLSREANQIGAQMRKFGINFGGEVSNAAHFSGEITNGLNAPGRQRDQIQSIAFA